jgi:hypothetical protein
MAGSLAPVMYWADYIIRMMMTMLLLYVRDLKLRYTLTGIIINAFLFSVSILFGS